MAISRLSWQSWIFIPTPCPPSIILHWLNLVFLSKCKIHIDIQHLLKLSSSTECKKGHVFNKCWISMWILDFWKITKFSPWKTGRHANGINGFPFNLERVIHLLKPINGNDVMPWVYLQWLPLQYDVLLLTRLQEDRKHIGFP